MTADSSSVSFFEAKYSANPDPWGFEIDPYEQRRYRSIIDALGGRKFGRAFEPGCSIGVLTVQLAAYCASLEAIDASPTAVAQAQGRCRYLSHVRISMGIFPDDLPGGTFDLIVFSEIGYYFDRKELAHLMPKILDRLDTRGTLIAAHWLGVSEDHKISGDEVHEVIGSESRIELTHSLRYEESSRARYRLDRWCKV